MPSHQSSSDLKASCNMITSNIFTYHDLVPVNIYLPRFSACLFDGISDEEITIMPYKICSPIAWVLMVLRILTLLLHIFQIKGDFIIIEYLSGTWKFWLNT